MEETGILENPALLSLVLPDSEPGRIFRVSMRKKGLAATGTHTLLGRQFEDLLADRQVEKDFVGVGFGVKSAGQSVLGGVGLLVEELAADLMFPGQI